MYPSSRYATYEYEDDSVPHSSHNYYETSEYPGNIILILHFTFYIFFNIKF